MTGRPISWGGAPAPEPPLVREPSASLTGFRHDHAVIVGIDRYADDHIRNLSTAVHDARCVATVMREIYGYQVEALYDGAATGAALRALFQDTLRSHVGKEDRLFVYYAGHGMAADSDRGPAGSLVPHDARVGDPSTLWAMSELYASLEALGCRHVLVVLDCCFAGSFRWASSRELPLRKQTLYRERYQRCVDYRAWQALTSAAYDQEARDLSSSLAFGGRAESGEHSPFARAFIEALSGEVDGLSPKHPGTFTVTTLYAYLRDAVPELLGGGRRAQIPGLWQMPRHDKGEFVFLRKGSRISDLEQAPEPTPEHNPYLGLETYKAGDRDKFFGRERVSAKLLAMVRDARLTLVVGPSGAGKSSLIQAGLWPALKEEGWDCRAPVRPGAQPGPRLAEVSQVAIPAGMDGAVDAAAGKPLLLVIDQMDEIYTHCNEESTREEFFDLLHALSGNSGVHIVASLRSEFEVQVRDALNRPEKEVYYARFPVPPMNADELRAAILGPAQMHALFFDPPGLVDELVNEVLFMPGALPLLSYTLSELYQCYVKRAASGNRPSRALERDDYAQLGGVIGVLHERTTAAMEQWQDMASQTAVRQVLLRMIDNQGGQWARRRVHKVEFDYGDETENARVDAVLSSLEKEARLIVSNNDFFEPAHDALVPVWAERVDWGRAEAEVPAAIRRRLSETALARKAGAGVSLWYADRSLPQVVKLLARSRDMSDGLRLNRIETRFVAESRMWRNLLTGAVWVVALILVALLMIALWQYQRADGLRYAQIVDTARVAASRGDWVEGDASYRRAIGEDRNDRLWLEIERLPALFALNRRDDLENTLRGYLARDDLGRLRPVVTLLYGDFLMSQGPRYDEGKKLVAEALEHAESLDEIDRLHAQGLLADSEAEAIDNFQRALDREPFHHRANANLLVQLVSSGRYAEAREQARRMRDFFPADPLAYLAEALMELLHGHPDRAVAYLHEHEVRFGVTQRERLERMFEAMQDLMVFLRRYNDPDHEHSFADTMILAGLLSELGAASHDPALGGLGLDVAMARKASLLGEGLIPVITAVATQNWQAALEQLQKLHQRVPDAALLLGQGVLYMLLTMENVSQSKHQAARTHLARAREMFARAKDAPSLVPDLSQRYARIATLLTDATALLLEPDNKSNLPAIRSNLDWLANDAETTAHERRLLLEILDETLPPELTLRVLMPWLAENPADARLLVLRAELELQAGEYAAAFIHAREARFRVPERRLHLLEIEREARAHMRHLMQ